MFVNLLYSSCVRSSMLHGSETWPVRKENVVALQRAEMSMVRWMCGVKLKDRLPSKELRERLGVDDIALVLQQNSLRWYGHVLQKDDDDWVKKCMEHEVEGSRPRGRPKKTRPGKRLYVRTVKHVSWIKRMPWTVANGDKGSTMIRMGVSGWMFLLVPAYPGCPGSKPLNGRCCCVNIYLSLFEFWNAFALCCKVWLWEHFRWFHASFTHWWSVSPIGLKHFWVSKLSSLLIRAFCTWNIILLNCQHCHFKVYRL